MVAYLHRLLTISRILRNFQKDNSHFILCYNFAYFCSANHLMTFQDFAIFLPILSIFFSFEILRKLEFLFNDQLQFIFDHDDGKGCVKNP